MKHLLSSLLVIAAVSLTCGAQAQQAKVIKVKGQQAIVQFPPGTPPVVGEMIPVGGEAAVEGGGHAGRGSRAHNLTFQADLMAKSVKTDTPSSSSSVTQFDLAALYGWNLEIMEFGPLGQVNYFTTTGLTKRIVTVGGFFDFNFVPNKPGTTTVYGVGAAADFGQNSQTLGSVDTTLTVMDLFLGGNIKWFGLGESVALRGDGGFNYHRESGNNSTTTETGLLLKAGVAFYF